MPSADEISMINYIIDLLVGFDPDEQERILSYIQARLQTEWERVDE